MPAIRTAVPIPSAKAAREIGGVVGPAIEDLCVVADFDACWIDGRRIETLAGWSDVLRQSRLSEVNGAFALAWPEPDGAVCLARDHIGERSLFYATAGNRLIFGSNVASILASGLVRPLINHTAVARYLSYGYLPGKDTLLDGIFKVLPGEIVRFRDGTLSFTSYWSLPAETDRESAADEATLRHDLRRELEAAVRRRLPDHGPVAAFLSGGIDSSLVVALARRLHPDDVFTYSVSFGAAYRNELPFSSLVAEHCGTRHQVVELSPAAILNSLDLSIASLGDPIGDPLTVPNFLLFQQAAERSAMVLNGEGGDPCFGGPKNIPMLLADLFGDGGDTDADDRTPYQRERHYLRAHQKCFDDVPSMLAKDVAASIDANALECQLAPFFADSRWQSLIGKLMAINVAFKGPFHILHKVDALSAVVGAVPRSPLFDRAIVEAAFQIPSRLKLRGSVEKYLLKEAVRDLLPSAIVDRPKSGMLVPVEGWFKGPLLPHARERLIDGLTPYGLFDRGYLERLLSGRLAGLRPRRGIKIWLLVTLEAWLRAVTTRDAGFRKPAAPR